MAVKPVNHPLHIILSILTLGFWLLVYVPILLVNGSRKKREYRKEKRS